MHSDIIKYNNKQTPADKEICTTLASLIDSSLKESKIWHSHPVWFIDGNPIAGYSKQKPGIRLMFWSGADFDEEKLIIGTGKFKDASVFYTSAGQINPTEIKRWLKKSKSIQWDYKNLVKRKGRLEMIVTTKKSNKS
ncbi:MAG: DUF1801 domain-containing protein [Ferruginibacter sp.]|nr:DUF1801 domain-containing protein [Ferruginibacter sp.]